MERPPIKALGKRLGCPVSPTLEQLIDRAYALDADAPQQALSPIGLTLPWIGPDEVAAASILAGGEDPAPVGVLPFAFVGRSAMDYAGLFRKSKKAPVEQMPVLVYLAKTCYHDEVLDVDQALVRDLGYRSAGALAEDQDAERLVLHQVVAKDLREFLSLVVTVGHAELCRHLDPAAEPREVDDPDRLAAVKQALLTIPGVELVAHPDQIVRAAPRLKLKFPPKPPHPMVLRREELIRKRDTLPGFFDPRLLAGEGAVLKYQKCRVYGSGDATTAEITFRDGVAFTAEQRDQAVELARAAVRAWNASEPVLRFSYLQVVHRSYPLDP